MSEISRSQGTLFFRKENGELGYFGNGDEDKDRKYVGEIENGLPNGQGTYTWSDGRKCVGEYKDGKPNGQGIFTDPNGTMYVGKYRYGKLSTGIFYNKNRNISFKVVNGRKIKQ